MFETLPEPRPDPILALMDTFRADPRPDRVDLGVGVYRDAEGRTPVMQAVRQAERRLLESQASKTYVGMLGDVRFNAAMGHLVFGDAVNGDRLAVIQSVGGSGALRLLFDLVRRASPEATVWTSTPTWPNHGAIIREVGLPHAAYRYYDAEAGSVDFAAMKHDLAGARPGDVVLLHGCCHNPTGADLAEDDWRAIAELCVERQLVPFVDLAYQGLGLGLEADARGLRAMAALVPEMLVAASCSKTFGVYRDRVGAAMVLAGPDRRTAARGALAALARTNYSMPPDHGAAVVGQVLVDPELRAVWEEELERMRCRIVGLRSGLASALAAAAGSDRFAALATQRGLFSLLPATPRQVAALREDHAIYVIDDGRINVAGLPEDRLGAVARAFLSVGL